MAATWKKMAYEELGAVPASDLTASGPKATMTAGENLAFGNLCYLKSDGKWWKADADTSATVPGMAIALATINADASGVFALPGSFVRDDSWTWTVGGILYVSTAAGAMTHTPPSGVGDQVQAVGYAYSADVVCFEPAVVLVEIGEAGAAEDSVARSMATSAATLAGSQNTSQATNVSVADSKAVSAQAYASSGDTSAVTRLSTVDSSLTSTATLETSRTTSLTTRDSAITSTETSRDTSSNTGVSTADSKAVSAQTYAASGDTSAVTRLSTVDSQGVSTNVITDSKAVSAGTQGSVVLSTSGSADTSSGTRTSIADSKAVSAALIPLYASAAEILAGTEAAKAIAPDQLAAAGITGGGGITWSIITADPGPAIAGSGYICNTSGAAFTVTLPAAPAVGDIISFTDGASTFDTANLTIGRAALKIMGLAEDMTVLTKNAAFSLVYSDATNGWRIA